MIKIFLKSLLIILTISLNAYAGVTNATQSTSTITKIAQSLGHSSKSVVNQSSNSSTTSSIINSADLKSDIKADAVKFGLSVDTAAADVLTAEIEEEKERKLLVLTKCCSSIAVVINAALNITGAAINTIVMAVRKCSLIIPYIIHNLLTDLCHIHPLFSISFTFRIKGGKK